VTMQNGKRYVWWRVKIDLQPVGAIVKTSEIGQAVSSGVVDMGHWVTAYGT